MALIGFLLSFIILRRVSEKNTKIDILASIFMAIIFQIIYITELPKILYLIHLVFWITAITDLKHKMIYTYPITLLTIILAFMTKEIVWIGIAIILILVSTFLIKDNNKYIGAGDIDIFIMLLLITLNPFMVINIISTASIIGVIWYFIRNEREMPFVPMLYFGWLMSFYNIGVFQLGGLL